jgi:hypothetical protein
MLNKNVIFFYEIAEQKGGKVLSGGCKRKGGGGRT